MRAIVVFVVGTAMILWTVEGFGDPASALKALAERNKAQAGAKKKRSDLPPFFESLTLSAEQDEQLVSLYKQKRKQLAAIRTNVEPDAEAQQIEAERKYFKGWWPILTAEQQAAWVSHQDSLYLPNDDWKELEFTDSQTAEIRKISTGVYHPWLESADNVYRAQERRLDKQIESQGMLREQLKTRALQPFKEKRDRLFCRLEAELSPILTKEQQVHLDAIDCRRYLDESEFGDLDLTDQQLSDIYPTMKVCQDALKNLSAQIEWHENLEQLLRDRLAASLEVSSDFKVIKLKRSIDKVREEKALLVKEHAANLDEISIALDEVLSDKQKRTLYARLPLLRRKKAPAETGDE